MSVVDGDAESALRPEPEGKRYHCQDCKPGTNARDVGFRQKKQLYAHRTVVHKASDQCLPCPHPGCNRLFVCRSKLQIHQRRHAIRRCDDCGSEFVGFQALRRHRSLEHQQPVDCPECGVQLASRALLKQHADSVHRSSDPPSHRCTYPGCGKAYTLARNLQQHVRSRHLGTRFPCPRPGCTYSLCTAQKLRLHLLLHDRGRVMRPPRQPAPRPKPKPMPPTSQTTQPPSRVGLLRQAGQPRRPRQREDSIASSGSSFDSDNSLVRLVA